MSQSSDLSAKLVGKFVARYASTDEQRIRLHRFIILFVTFIVYATYHASRRPMSIVKGELHRNCTTMEDYERHHTNWNHSTVIKNVTQENCSWPPFDHNNAKNLFGILDSCFLFMYAFCMFGAGYFAERSNLRLWLCIWLSICGLTLVGLGLANTMEVHQLWYFIILQLVAGIAQTSGWPAVVAVVGEWYGNSKKGLIMGFWNWHTSVGNIVGAAVAASFVDTNWGMSFYIPGVMCFGVAIFAFFFLIPKPSSVGLTVDFAPTHESVSDIRPTEDDNIYGATIKHSSPPIGVSISKQQIMDDRFSSSESIRQPARKYSVPHSEEAISLWRALKIPGVMEFSVCLFFAKLVSYTFLYWLPLYIEEQTHSSASSSAFQSIMFDIGGCLGSIVAGFLADRTGASAITCIVFLILAIPSLLSYYLFAKGTGFTNQALQFVAGAFVNGPYSLITTAVSANLACKVPSQSAMATVSAIIDGTGSIGAAIGPLLAPLVTGENNWLNLFLMCIVSDIVAILSLLRIAYTELVRLQQT